MKKSFISVFLIVICLQLTVYILENECCIIELGFERCIRALEQAGYTEIEVLEAELLFKDSQTKALVNSYLVGKGNIIGCFFQVFLFSNPPPRGTYILEGRIYIQAKDPNGLYINSWTPYGVSTDPNVGVKKDGTPDPHLIEVRTQMPSGIKINP